MRHVRQSPQDWIRYPIPPSTSTSKRLNWFHCLYLFSILLFIVLLGFRCESPGCGICVHKKCQSSAMSSPCPHPSLVASGIFKRKLGDCYQDALLFMRTAIRFIERMTSPFALRSSFFPFSLSGPPVQVSFSLRPRGLGSTRIVSVVWPATRDP